MNDFGPYSADELREMRCLIVASGSEIALWCDRLRRSADFVSSLSPAQAGIVAEQAAAIAEQPDDHGGEELLAVARARLDTVAPGDRAAFVWRQIVEIRRRHYPSEDSGLRTED